MFVHWALDKRTPVQARENGAKAELLSFTKTSFILFWTFTVETCKLILLAVVNFIRYGLLNKINFGRAPPGPGRPPGGAPRRPLPARGRGLRAAEGAAGPAPPPALPAHRRCPPPGQRPAAPGREDSSGGCRCRGRPKVSQAVRCLQRTRGLQGVRAVIKHRLGHRSSGQPGVPRGAFLWFSSCPNKALKPLEMQ